MKGIPNFMPPIWGVEALASLAKVVQDDPEPDSLASHLALSILESLDCRAVALGVIQKDGFLDLIGSYGLSSKTTSPYTRMPLWSPLPMTVAARHGEFIFIKDYEDLITRFPLLASSDEHRDAATVASPVMYRNTVIGSVAFASIKPPNDDFRANPITHTVLSIVGLYMKSFLNRKLNSSRDYSGALKSLSERQKLIIKLFKDELTTDQMADRLRFSPSTIKQDIIKIYDLFGVNTRDEVVNLAENAGLLDGLGRP